MMRCSLESFACCSAWRRDQTSNMQMTTTPTANNRRSAMALRATTLASPSRILELNAQNMESNAGRIQIIRHRYRRSSGHMASSLSSAESTKGSVAAYSARVMALLRR